MRGFRGNLFCWLFVSFGRYRGGRRYGLVFFLSYLTFICSCCLVLSERTKLFLVLFVLAFTKSPL